MSDSKTTKPAGQAAEPDVELIDFPVEVPDAKAEKLDDLVTHRRAEILPDGTRRWRCR